ncbi:MAG: flagellin lysine-N-methylase [Oscillospiraceae bacterium]|nr:flagellin lysine-N-methylase [Oscillospiraceae bacterium]
MNGVVYPDYYRKFKCIADRCTDSCCIGWEIDIDSESMERYKNCGGELGRRLSENIALSEDGTLSFILGENERCPFLNSRNLCDIYAELGEDALCKICADHPRFRSFFSDRTEVGLGLCCEAAAKIILSRRGIFSFENPEEPWSDSFENALLDIRREAFRIVSADGDVFENLGRLLNFSEAAQYALDNGEAVSADNIFGGELPFLKGGRLAENAVSLLGKMESISAEWDNMLAEIISGNYETAFPERVRFDINEELEQAAQYFIFRHFPEAIDDGDVLSKAYFAAFGCAVIYVMEGVYLRKNGGLSFTDRINAAKLFSKQAEYSEENMEMFFEWVWDMKGGS